MSSIEDRVRASFDRQNLMKTFGARLDAVARGEVTISGPVAENALQQQGIGHAGLAFSLGDSAAGYAALSVLPDDHEVVTSEMKIHLLAPAAGERLIARGRVVKPGRRLVVVMAEVFALRDGVEKQIALMTGTTVPVPL
ncbi:PaaI family thioesterase [Roseivivax sp. CAU 1761]